MNLKKTERRFLATLCLLTSANVALSQTILYEEQFDGTGNGYNPDSATAVVGDADWVDTANRLIPNFAENEGRLRKPACCQLRRKNSQIRGGKRTAIQR